MVDPSTQEHATGSSSDGPLWEAQIGKKSTAEASTQTNEDVIVNDRLNDSLSSPITLVTSHTDHGSAVDSEDSESQEEAGCEGGLLEQQDEEEQMQEENTGETAEEVQDTEDIGSTATVDEALSNELAAHQRTRKELAQLQEQITTKDTQIQTANDDYLSLLRQSNESHQQLEEGRDDLLEELEEANSRISELQDSNGDNVRRLEFQVEYLTNAAQRMWDKIADQHNIIRVGCNDLSFYIRLGTKLHARLNRVDRIMKSSRWTPSSVRAELGSANRLMRLAEKWFPIAVAAKKHSTYIQLAIEGPPADILESIRTESVSGREGGMVDTNVAQLMSNTLDVQEGQSDDSGKLVDVEAGRPALNTFHFSNVRDAAPHTAPTNTSEGTSMDSGFTFSTGSPDREIKNTAKKPVFKFGGTPAQDPRPKAKCKAKEPAPLFAAIPAQETLEDVPSRITASAQIFTFPQQTAPPNVQAANHNSKAKAEWVDVEEQAEGPTKKSRTTSIREAATSVVDFTSSSSDTKEENANKKTKKASIYDTATSINLSTPSSGTDETVTVFDAAATVNLSPLSSGNNMALGASIEQDHKRTPETPKKIYKPIFNFSETAAKGEEPAPRTASPPMLGVGTSTQFAFSPSGIMPNFGGFNSNPAGTSNALSDPNPVVTGGEDKQNQESTKEASAPASTTEENSDSVREIEDGYGAPAKESAKVEHVETGPTSAIDSAVKNQGEAVSSEPNQVSLSTAQTQLPDLSAISGSSQPVQSQGELQEVTGTSSAEASRTSSTAPSTSAGGVEGEASGVLGKLGFNVAALTRIVSSVPPAVPETLGVVDTLNGLNSRGAKPVSQTRDSKDERDISQGSGRAAAEVVACREIEGRERAEPATDPVPWRDPEWAAALPPLEDPEPEWSAELSPLATPLTTATTTRRRPTSSQAAMSSLEAVEEGFRYIMAGIESLHIGPAAPPVIYVEFDPDKHFLSGDWVARRHTIREVICGDEKPVEQRRAGRAVVRGHESQVPSQPEIGKEKISTTPVGEAQEAMASCEHERSVDLKAVVESEPKETDSATTSNARLETQTALQERPQMRPQMAAQIRPQAGLQMEATATSETRAPESIAETGRESQEQKKDATAKKPSDGLRICSLKKKR